MKNLTGSLLRGKIYLYFYLMTLFRILLSPLSVLYGLITYVRNRLFDWNLLNSVSFPIPIISIGNLCSGGTGKTPHVEYLIRLLRSEFRLATLSRGYKRKSKGFVLAGDTPSVEVLGDEPLQFKIKYENIEVAVDERRVHGVGQLLKKIDDLDLVLLDDAYQHRWIQAGLSILLTDYYKLYSKDYMLPTGNLREFRCGAKRADIIIITKSPAVLSPLTRRQVIDSIKPGSHQTVFFSYIEHGSLKQIPGIDFIPADNFSTSSVLLIAGIANPYPLERYLKDRCAHLEKIYFSDHHDFKAKDIDRIIKTYDGIISKNKLIVTTEKDMMRFIHPDFISKIKHLPVCYLPIEVKFHREDRESFEKQILNNVEHNKRNR